MEEEIDCFTLSEDTVVQMADKISAMASSIRGDWTDPRSECREIWRLCTKIKENLNGTNT